MSFQTGVEEWMLSCFGPVISGDKAERNHRFLEESLELVQACGVSRDECIKLVDYVFSRPIGEPEQEVGGVLVTLAALCSAHEIHLQSAGEIELRRVWTQIERIRRKQASKPKSSPLPQ
jgi:hypothetical protein